MILDTLTLSFTLGILFLIFGLALLFIARSLPLYKGISWWAACCLFRGAGFIYMYFGRIEGLESTSIFYAELFQTFGSVFLYVGTLLFLRKPLKLRLFILLSIVFIISLAYFTFINDQIEYRMIDFSIAMAILNYYLAMTFLRVKDKRIKQSTQLIGGIFLIISILMLIRTLISINRLLQFDTVYLQSFALVFAIVFLTIQVVAMILLINQRIQAELTEAKNHFELFFHSIPLPITISDPIKGVLLHVNKSFETISGYTSEEAIGKTYNELELWKSIDDRFLFMRGLEKEGFISNQLIPFQNKIGDDIWTLISARLFENDNETQMLSILNPINDLRRLEAQTTTLKRAVEQSPVSILITNALGEIEYVNPRFTQTTGYTYDDAIGQNPRILKSGKMSNEVYSELWQTIRAGKEWRGELQNRKKNGDVFWEMASISGIKDDQGVVNQFVAVKEDITERKRLEAEMKEKNIELEYLNAQKDKFFSIISHDLRGPFNGFLGLLDFMAEDIQNMTMDEIQDIAKNMKRSADNLFSLLTNLLEWSRTQSGHIQFIPEQIHVDSVIDMCMKVFEEQSRQKEVAILYNIDHSISVFADSYMLQTIILNLVGNAMKFSRRGGQIQVKVQNQPSGETLFSVHDTGIGMSPKILNNLFKIDVNVSRKGTEGELSTGLGLILCKEFIEKHGGKIWAESQVDQGSTFYFTLS